MAYLYQKIHSVPGLSGKNSFAKQKQLYERLGNPYGRYTGSYNQNIWLLNQINKGNYGQPKPAPKAPVAPAAGGTQRGSMAQKYAQAVLPKKITTPTPFGKVLNKDDFVNRDLVQQFAYSQVDPEIGRMRDRSFRDLYTNQAQTGAYRFGQAKREQQDLSDAISRQRQEMAQPFLQTGLNTLSDYYGTLEEEYYKDPNAFEYKPVDVNKLLSKT